MITIFGSIAVAIMLISYRFEHLSAWFILTFAIGSAATAVYSGLEGVWPIASIEGIWSIIALQRFLHRRHLHPGLTTLDRQP
ncbi:hypothetical protein FIM12_01030 [SAR202 cluster bacterium AD-804-J14_MRT_500m]|nr:hypothetical protein [SAR202 cluster bacterium AD-804-J14_MRT_500m]